MEKTIVPKGPRAQRIGSEGPNTIIAVVKNPNIQVFGPLGFLACPFLQQAFDPCQVWENCQGLGLGLRFRLWG